MLALLEKIILATLSPAACIVCGVEGAQLCGECQASGLSAKISSCYRCNQLTAEFRTCRSCRSSTPLRQVIVLARYEGLIRKMILQVKHQPDSSTGRHLGLMLAQRLRGQVSSLDAIITWVPASRSGRLMRGFDQGEVLAKAVARELSLPCLGLVGRVGVGGDSRALSRAVRLRRHNGAMRLVGRVPENCKNVIIVDDVLTTGASIESVAKVLKLARPSLSIYGLVVAKSSL